MKQATRREESTEVYDAFKACRGAFVGVAVFSAIVNLLALTGSLYMLQIYDRVLSSKSISTLVGLSLITLAAYVLSGGLDTIRSKMLARIGARFDEQLARRIFDLVATMPLKGAKASESLQPVRDLDQIRGFLSGMGPTALFDMPFMPIFFIACFIIHPWLGWFSIVGGVVIVLLTLYTEAKSRGPMYDLTRSGAERHALAETSRRNAEAVRALGMLGFLAARYDRVHTTHVNDGLRASESASVIGAFAKVFRMVLQSGILGMGALLVIEGQMSAGSMIAASIMMSRALAPIEIAVANWKGFIGARQSYRRLQHILSLIPAQGKRLPLPAPKREVLVEDLYVGAPGHQRTDRPGGDAAASGGPGPGPDRSLGLGQVVPGPRPGRRVADPARRGAPRRGGDRPVGAGRAGPACRLPAPGRGAVRRHDRREHRPLPARRGARGDHRGGAVGGRSRADPGPGGWLRHGDR